MSNGTCPQFLSQNTGSGSALGFLATKYRECLKHHNQCSPRPSSSAWYPSRVIEVGENRGDPIHLRETKNFSDQGPYFTLSHCWGQSHPFALKKDTVSTLKAGLPVHKLPKTFQDAVTVAQHFQVRYLWIDSLCIFQDDIDDWSAESGDMRNVYSRAACNIGATAATNSDGGLFFNRDPAVFLPRRIQGSWAPSPNSENSKFPSAGSYYCDNQDVWFDNVEKAPLNKRAWVSQERYLSPRILHFGARQVFWECQHCKASEVYPGGLPKWAMLTWSDDASSLARPHEIYYLWAVFRISYTECEMTKEEDKLVAIRGIAQDVTEALDDNLVAGLWRNRIIEELCWSMESWSGTALARPLKWRAPTWSWASTNGTV
ncbi:HET-domain-containing protein, partial [Lophium mytilinum]